MDEAVPHIAERSGTFLTQRELSERWKVSGRTLERWRAERYGPAWVILGGSIRYSMTDVLAWETAHRRTP